MKTKEIFLVLFLGAFFYYSFSDIKETQKSSLEELKISDSDNPVGIVEVNQIDFINPISMMNSTVAEIKYEYNIPASSNPKYLNIITDSLYYPFSEKWVVQNIYLHPFNMATTVSYWIDLSELGLDSGSNLSYISLGFVESDSVWTTQHTTDTSYYYPVGNRIYNIGAGLIDTNYLFPTTQLQYQFNWILPIPPIIGVFRNNCQVPNVDLDRSINPPGIPPGYAGDRNACVPAACANSIGWLESVDTRIVTGLTLREKLVSISNSMNRAPDAGVVSMKQAIEGKLKFIDDRQIPVSVKFQSCYITDSVIQSPTSNYTAKNEGLNLGDTNFQNRTSWDWLLNEMQDSEDVELFYQSRNSGHVVVLTGMIDWAGVRGIWFKDDSNQEDTLGLRNDQFVEVGTGPGGFLYLNFPLLGTRRIAGAISESYDENIWGISYDPNIIPFKYELFQNFPNPFNPTTNIKFEIPKSSFVIMTINNILGQEIAILINQKLKIGSYTVDWNASNHPSGVYFYKLITEDFIDVKKMVLLK